MSVGPDILRAELVAERSPRAVPLARAGVTETLRRWCCPPGVVDDAALLLTELVTNSVRHGHGSRVTVHLACRAGVLRCEVQDQGHGSAPPSCRAVDPLSDHGRGLHLVDAIASRWGSCVDVRGGRGCRVVWFEIGQGRGCVPVVPVVPESDPDVLRRVLGALRRL